jgi:1-acyl-sn-glycerol-3-phosphate acyltransferase
MAGRVVALVAVALAAAVVVPLLPRSRMPGALPRIARAMLRALGVRHEVHGRLPRRSALLMANHVSWLDIVVLLAHGRCRLLAKREVRDWPVIGRLARSGGSLFIDRSRPRSLPDTVARVADALRAGAVVAAFPEGTTWCGRMGGPFRPALFQSAIMAGTAVVPVRLAFRLGDGSATTVAAFIADGTLLASLGRVIATRGLTITVRAYPALHPAPGSSRRALASAAGAVVGTGSPVRRPALSLVPAVAVPHPRNTPVPAAA